MDKAGKNLKFVRTGITLGMHVGTVGEVIPLPSPDTFPLTKRPMTEEEQSQYYGVVFYELTDEEVNTGPMAQVPWRAQVSPATPRGNPFGSFGDPVPPTSQVERGAAGITVDRKVKDTDTTSGRPDAETVPGDKKHLPFLEEKSDEEEAPETIRLKRKEFGKSDKHKKKKVVGAKATALSKKG